MQVSVHKKGWMDEEGIYHFACLFSFCSVMYQITEHMHPSTYHIFDHQGSLFIFDRHLIISALMFGFTINNY